MNKKIKKTLKITGGIIIGMAGAVGVYSLIKHPEVRGEIVDSLKKVGDVVTSPFKEKEQAQPQTKEETPKREGRNYGGYYKPRYNNDKKFNNQNN